MDWKSGVAIVPAFASIEGCWSYIEEQGGG